MDCSSILSVVYLVRIFGSRVSGVLYIDAAGAHLGSQKRGSAMAVLGGSSNFGAPCCCHANKLMSYRGEDEHDTR